MNSEEVLKAITQMVLEMDQMLEPKIMHVMLSQDKKTATAWVLINGAEITITVERK